jgi:hypothetical protein
LEQDCKSKEQIIKEIAENALLLAAKAVKVTPASPDPKPADKAQPKAKETVLSKHPSSSSKPPSPLTKEQAATPQTTADKTTPTASKPSSKPKQDAAALKPQPLPAAGAAEGDSKPAAKGSILSAHT